MGSPPSHGDRRLFFSSYLPAVLGCLTHGWCAYQIKEAPGYDSLYQTFPGCKGCWLSSTWVESLRIKVSFVAQCHNPNHHSPTHSSFYSHIYQDHFLAKPPLNSQHLYSFSKCISQQSPLLLSVLLRPPKQHATIVAWSSKQPIDRCLQGITIPS